MEHFKPSEKKFRSVTLRQPGKVMEIGNKIAKKNDSSRQELIAIILKQVIIAHGFGLLIEG